MRPVNFDHKNLVFPEGWKEKAENALQAVKAVPDNQKSSEVKKYSKIWSELKHELSKVMHGKCWYTESPQTGTDCDVDHFRPKNSVKNAKKVDSIENHPGYWWLAFDPSNYRYSCIVANRARRDIETGIVGGKADEFPLLDEGKRVWCFGISCIDEQPLLLDPCVPADVGLIAFAENGEAIIRYSEEKKPIAYKRAAASILLYHLNHSDFIRDRIKIRDNINKNIEDAERYFRKYGTEISDADNDNAYSRAIEELRKSCREDAPYSSFATAMLRPYRLEESLEPVFVGM